MTRVNSLYLSIFWRNRLKLLEPCPGAALDEKRSHPWSANHVGRKGDVFSRQVKHSHGFGFAGPRFIRLEPNASNNEFLSWGDNFVRQRQMVWKIMQFIRFNTGHGCLRAVNRSVGKRFC